MSVNIFSAQESASSEYSCAVLWFPEETHVELEVKENSEPVIYNLFCGGVCKCLGVVYSRYPSGIKLRALSGEGSGYYRIQLSLQKGEYEQLLQRLKEGNLPLGTCSGSVARLLNQVGDLRVPVLSSMFPERLVQHLWKMREVPGSKVEKIEMFTAVDISQSLQETSDQKPKASHKILSPDLSKKISEVVRLHSALFFFSAVLIGGVVWGAKTSA